MSEEIRTTLNERGKRYGLFINHANLSQKLMITFLEGMRVAGNFTEDAVAMLQPFQREAAQMIFHKLARIANGDPDYADSWRDIAGYAQLVVDILEPKKDDQA